VSQNYNEFVYLQTVLHIYYRNTIERIFVKRTGDLGNFYFSIYVVYFCLFYQKKFDVVFLHFNRDCPKACISPEKKVSTPHRRRSRVADRGQVTTRLGTPRQRSKRSSALANRNQRQLRPRLDS
jgi:hypothetical protein